MFRRARLDAIRPLPDREAFIWVALVILVTGSIVLPTAGGAAHAQQGGYLGMVADNGYQLIKLAMLWVPAGLVLGLAGYARIARRIAMLAAGLILLIGAALALTMSAAHEALALLHALPGLAAGLWLAGRQPMTTDSGAVPTPAIDTVPPPAAAGAPDAALALRRALALALLGLAGFSVWRFPLAQLPLALGLAAYFALLVRWPRAWLIVVPAALPVLDLAFWSGRFFWDEFDLLLLVTLAGALWQRERARTVTGLLPLALIALLALSVAASALAGLLPLQALDANAFSSYWSHYNALRVTKGFVWGVLLWWMGRGVLEPANFRLLAIGMVAGLAATSASALWEAWLFTGFRLDTDYRVTGPFSSMHTGGGHVEAYLAAALPFAWALAAGGGRGFLRLLGASAFLLAAAAIVVTVARAGLIALFVVAAVLAAASLRNRVRAARPGASLALLAAAVTIVGLGVAGGVFLKQRFETTVADAGTRLAHWRGALAFMDDRLATQAFGMGLGRFPETYLLAHVADRPATYRYAQEDGNTYLALSSGGNLYMAQAVSARPGTAYTLEFDLRSDGRSQALEYSLCEKKLFNSHRCQWGGTRIEPQPGSWQHRTVTLDAGEVGAGPWWARRPVQFSLYNPQPGTRVDIDNVRLRAPDGTQLIANGDFAAGGDFWFFKAGDHLPWHVKNLWVHTAFEQGALGVLAVAALGLGALARSGARAWRGHARDAALFASIAALLTVGVADSLVDAPRLAALAVFVCLLGATRAPARA